MKIRKLKMSEIRVDQQYQPRKALNEEEIRNYAELLKNGESLPPIVVFEETKDSYVLASGFHRFEAHKRIEALNIEAEVRIGSSLEILTEAIQSNAKHGIRYTNEDKWRCVQLITSHPDGKDLSDNHIAKLCGVSNHLVKKIREELGGRPEEGTVLASRNGTVYAMDKSKIGPRVTKAPSLQSVNTLLASKTIDIIRALTAFRHTYDQPEIEIPADFDEAIYEFVAWYTEKNKKVAS